MMEGQVRGPRISMYGIGEDLAVCNNFLDYYCKGKVLTVFVVNFILYIVSSCQKEKRNEEYNLISHDRCV